MAATINDGPVLELGESSCSTQGEPTLTVPDHCVHLEGFGDFGALYVAPACTAAAATGT